MDKKYTKLLNTLEENRRSRLFISENVEKRARGMSGFHSWDKALPKDKGGGGHHRLTIKTVGGNKPDPEEIAKKLSLPAHHVSHYMSYGNLPSKHIYHVKEGTDEAKIVEDAEMIIENVSPKQIAMLKKQYSSMPDRLPLDQAMKMSKMVANFDKASLMKVAKADIKWLSSAAKTNLISKHGATAKDFKESVDKDMSNMVCEDCGCSFGEPVPDCNCPNDVNDPNGSNWIEEISKLNKDLEELRKQLGKSDSDQLTEEELEEAGWTPQMRRAAARRMRILAPKIKLGAKRSKNRTASREKLMNRAVKKVKNDLIKKFTKGEKKSDLNPARRAEMEKRIAKLGPRIKQLAMKQLPATRKLETDRKKARAK